MKRFRRGLALVWVGVCAMWFEAGWAQTVYRCTNEAGRPYVSDKPCSSGKLQQYGPVTPPPTQPGYRRSTTGASVGGGGRGVEVPPHHEFLSSECRALSERARNALSNGTSYEVLQGLRNEWQQKCLDDDELARRRYRESVRDERARRDDERRQQDASKAQQQVQQEQCGEMRRILRNKRERPQMSEGERADLARFEENYKSRCGG